MDVLGLTKHNLLICTLLREVCLKKKHNFRDASIEKQQLALKLQKCRTIHDAINTAYLYYYIERT